MTVLGILASGRGSNAASLMRACARGDLPARVGLVISDHPDAPVLDRAREFGVPARYVDPRRPGGRLDPAAETEYVEILQDAGVQWVALAGFMRILRGGFLRAFPGRVVNIHPSLLPAFPGLDAQRQALEYGVRVSGCTVHRVDEGVDTGPIVAQRAVPVDPLDTVNTLSSRILEAEHTLYVEALRSLLATYGD